MPGDELAINFILHVALRSGVARSRRRKRRATRDRRDARQGSDLIRIGSIACRGLSVKSSTDCHRACLCHRWSSLLGHGGIGRGPMVILRQQFIVLRSPACELGHVRARAFR